VRLFSKPVKLALFASALAIFMSLSWAIFDTVFHATSDYEFCTGCHSHQPIGSSYLDSLHGGNNPSGWRATCSDCHIDQTNALTYLWVKGVHGVVDPTMEILKDPYDIDWHQHREQRETYVYDSGCMGCHKFLAQRSQSNTKAFLPHRKYFNNTSANNSKNNREQTCVSCHPNVGHAALGNHLREQGWEEKE